MSAVRDRIRGALVGLAVGDAVGTTLEFSARDASPPLTDMVGGGPFDLEPGQWTDDTSMALCLGTSLVERGGFDPRDQLARYSRWAESGYLSSTGECFDIGFTVGRALQAFNRTGEAFPGSTDPKTAGNGSIMRLAPVVMCFHPDRDAAIRYAVESSRTTHGAAECLDACRILATMLVRAMDGRTGDALFAEVEGTWASPATASIARMGFGEKERDEIRSTGYVVHTLEAALWSLRRTTTFEDAVLLAANLAGDADTTAAVCGQLAGARYGESGIPMRWREKLAMRDRIEDLADALAGMTPSGAPAD